MTFIAKKINIEKKLKKILIKNNYVNFLADLFTILLVWKIHLARGVHKKPMSFYVK